MEPFSLENRVDGLIEARIFRLPDLETADSYAMTLADLATRLSARHAPVLCADHRPSRLTRVAVVVSRSNATLAMQLERIVREAKYPSRRVFYEANEAAVFLAAAIAPAAAERSRSFLREWSARTTDSPSKS